MSKTPTPEFANASAELVNGFADATALVPALVAVVVIVMAVTVASSFRRFEFVARQVEWILSTVEYALYGVATLVAVGAPVAIAWRISQLDGQTRGVIGAVGGAVVGGYVLLVAVGYVAKPLWGRIRGHFNRYVDERESQPASTAEGSD